MKNKRLISLSFFLLLNSPFLLTADHPCHLLMHDDERDISAYFNQIEQLKKEEQWHAIIFLGEKAILACQRQGEIKKEFDVLDQLVSTYFRLGAFTQAQDKAKCLIALGEVLNDHELTINCLYKFSAVLRGEAGSIGSDKLKAQKLYNESRKYIHLALELCEQACPHHEALKARVLFNAGAVEADDPDGVLTQAIASYQEALKLFTSLNELDYQQRTLIRLGKAYLLQNDLTSSREVIDQLKKMQFDKRTEMHFLYLEAQVLAAKHRLEEALNQAGKAKEIALDLHAQADLRRIEELIQLIKKR